MAELEGFADGQIVAVGSDEEQQLGDEGEGVVEVVGDDDREGVGAADPDRVLLQNQSQAAQLQHADEQNVDQCHRHGEHVAASSAGVVAVLEQQVENQRV